MRVTTLCCPDEDMDIGSVGLCAIHKRPPSEAKGCTTEMPASRPAGVREEEASSM